MNCFDLHSTSLFFPPNNGLLLVSHKQNKKRSWNMTLHVSDIVKYELNEAILSSANNDVLLLYNAVYVISFV